MHKFALSSQVKTFWWMKIEQNRGARYFLAYIGSLNKVNPIWLRNPYYCSVYMWIGLDGYLGLHLQSWLKGSRWQFSPFLSPCIHLSGTNVKGLPWTQWTDLLGKLILSLKVAGGTFWPYVHSMQLYCYCFCYVLLAKKYQLSINWETF